MASRLPTFLHPVAGRPLIWHTVSAILRSEATPDIHVWMPEEYLDAFPDDLASLVTLSGIDELARSDFPTAAGNHVLLVDGSGYLTPEAVARVVDSGEGWLGSGPDDLVALVSDHTILARSHGSGFVAVEPAELNGSNRLESDSFVVRSRADLAKLSGLVRDAIVAGLMDGGVTFLLPDTVIVDAEVTIGRDTIIYPGVVLEGTTNIGEETVIGPGCRIIDSWVGSGVELKGWNYISHASVRNRAILEPYVRRGFD